MRLRHRRERGAALLLVTIILIVVLVGGLAAVAVTSGELSSSRGYRTRQVSEACANIALEKVRATLEMPDLTAELATSGTITAGGSSLDYKVGHYGTGVAAVRVLDAASFDTASLDAGENITNSLAPGGGLKQVLAVTAVCPGQSPNTTGYGEREVELIFMSRY